MSRTAKAPQAILDILAQHHVLTGPDIVQALKDFGMPVNKTTVYRALDKLMEEGQICRLSLGENTPVYELRHHHHDHVVCQNCGKVAMVECATEYLPEVPGFTIDHHQATFFGICQDCQAKNA